MRLAYSGSMRPEFKVLACEPFRVKLRCTATKEWLLVTIRDPAGHTLVRNLRVRSLRSLCIGCNPCKAEGTYVNVGFDYYILTCGSFGTDHRGGAAPRVQCRPTLGELPPDAGVGAGQE